MFLFFSTRGMKSSAERVLFEYACFFLLFVVPGMVLRGYRYLFLYARILVLSGHDFATRDLSFSGSYVSTTCVAIGVIAAAASVWPTLGSSSYSSSRYYQ